MSSRRHHENDGLSDRSVSPSTESTSWPSQHGRPSRSNPTRRDGRLSRSRLLRATADMLATGEDFTLADVAAAAGVSTATAYRHFQSASDIAQAFVAGFLDDVEDRITTATDPPDSDPERRLLQLCRIWVGTVIDWGPALAHLRSPEGFLARRARQEPEMHRSLRHLEPTMRAVLARTSSAGVTEEELAYALSIWNALADPREVLDQTDALSWSPERITGHLHEAVLAVISRSGGDSRDAGPARRPGPAPMAPRS